MTNQRAIESLLERMYGGNMAKKSGSKWASVPEPGDEILVGGYNFKVKDVKVSKTGENSKTPDVKMYIAELVVVEPDELKGTEHAEFFMVGTPDDPDAEDAETLRGSRGAQAFKAFYQAATGEIPPDDDEEMVEGIKGETVFGNVDAPTKAGGRKGVKAKGWFPVGEQDPEVREEAPKTAKKAKPKKAEVEEPVKKKKPKVVEPEEEEDEDEPAPKKKPARKPVDEEEEETEEEDEDEPKAKAKRKPARDEDEEEEEEEETERPKRGTRR